MLPHPKSKWQRSDEDWRWFPLSLVGERVGARGNAAHEYSIAQHKWKSRGTEKT